MLTVALRPDEVASDDEADDGQQTLLIYSSYLILSFQCLDDDIVMPEGPPPTSGIGDIPMPEGPPPNDLKRASSFFSL